MMRSVIVCSLLLLAVAGCATARRIDAKYEELSEAWAVVHPHEPMTMQTESELMSKAKEQVDEDVKNERQEAAAKIGEVGMSFARGDLVGGIAGLIQLMIIGAGAIKKSKGAA